MGWDIKPSGVRGVLIKTRTAAEGFEKAGNALKTALPDAAQHAGTISMGGGGGDGGGGGGEGGGEGAGTGPIGGALAGLMASHDQRLAFIGARTGASVKGAMDATTAYVDGNLEQAATAQHNALQAPQVDLGAGQK
ncbi:DUF6507 family protein [Streptomyces goshikiensis]|uniref:DUF6507 family protein n=1 Tax=Streptomyces goshikiensis TaxID=1942 RepID=UPI003681FDC4